MAEVSLDTLEGLGTKPVPSLTDASIVGGYQRVTTVEGPIKIERNFYQQANGNDFADDDTFVTGLVRPFAVEVAPINGDTANATAFVGSAEVEGVETAATFRTVTLRDCDGYDDLGVLVTVYGY